MISNGLIVPVGRVLGDAGAVELCAVRGLADGAAVQGDAVAEGDVVPEHVGEPQRSDRHIGMVVDYTVGVATNDKAKQDKAVADLILDADLRADCVEPRHEERVGGGGLQAADIPG